MNDQPLVTFALYAYNQESLIREAVEAALSQDYPNLEIILSDDCSEDRTFQIMEQLADRYCGNHKIVLNRNPINLGIAGHINRLLEMASGELIITADGDDISERDRVFELVRHWLSNDKRDDAIWSAVTLIDENSQVIGELESPASNATIESQVRQMVPCFVGCAQAVTKRLYRQYGPLNADIIYEDRVLAFRALCAGGFSSVGKKLVRYRIHPNSISLDFKSREEKLSRILINRRLHLNRQYAVFNGYLKDFRKIKDELVEASARIKIEKAISASIDEISIELLAHSGSIADRLRGAWYSILNSHFSNKRRFRFLIGLIDPRLCVYDFKRIKHKLRKISAFKLGIF